MGVAEELAEAVESAVFARAAGAEKREGGGDGGEEGGEGEADCPLLMPWSLALDPGLGFSKTRAQNLSLLSRTEDLRRALPPQFATMPVLVGASRKGFLRTDAAGLGEKEAAGGENEKEPELLHRRDAATFASSAYRRGARRGRAAGPRGREEPGGRRRGGERAVGSRSSRVGQRWRAVDSGKV